MKEVPHRFYQTMIKLTSSMVGQNKTFWWRQLGLWEFFSNFIDISYTNRFINFSKIIDNENNLICITVSIITKNSHRPNCVRQKATNTHDAMKHEIWVTPGVCLCVDYERISASYLCHDLQRSFPSILSTDSELGRLVDQAAGLLEPWPVSLDLQPQKPALIMRDIPRRSGPVRAYFNGSYRLK